MGARKVVIVAALLLAGCGSTAATPTTSSCGVAPVDPTSTTVAGRPWCLPTDPGATMTTASGPPSTIFLSPLSLAEAFRGGEPIAVLEVERHGDKVRMMLAAGKRPIDNGVCGQRAYVQYATADGGWEIAAMVGLAPDQDPYASCPKTAVLPAVVELPAAPDLPPHTTMRDVTSGAVFDIDDSRTLA